MAKSIRIRNQNAFRIPKTVTTRKQWRDAFRISKGNYFQPTIHYSTNQVGRPT